MVKQTVKQTEPWIQIRCLRRARPATEGTSPPPTNGAGATDILSLGTRFLFFYIVKRF